MIAGGVCSGEFARCHPDCLDVRRAVSYLDIMQTDISFPWASGVAIGVVLLPTLSRKLRAGEAQAVLHGHNGLELLCSLPCPPRWLS